MEDARDSYAMPASALIATDVESERQRLIQVWKRERGEGEERRGEERRVLTYYSDVA